MGKLPSAKNMVIVFLIFAVCAIAVLAYQNTIMLETKITLLVENSNKQIDLLQKNITDLNGKIAAVSGESALVAKSLEEVSRKQQPPQKTQEELITAAVAKITPSVVSIVATKDIPKVEVVYQNPFGDDPFFKDVGVRVPVLRQKGVEKTKVSAGTGFIVTYDGFIVTNQHVVQDENASYSVILPDGKTAQAVVLSRDAALDAAVLKIPGNNFRPVTIGNSKTLKLGQTVIAIGNALGEYDNSVSTGIVSGLNRTVEAENRGTIERLFGVIQTDAAINLGNSGGPLIDIDGRVVGVNVATVRGSSNISFSIPINTILKNIETVIGRKLAN